MIRKRVLFVQFTNPAGYPPLEHSSRILADAGWEVTFIGTGADGESDRFRLPPHPRIRVKSWPFRKSGIGQKLLFAAFCLRALYEASRSRRCVIYASDALSCPAALLCSTLLGRPVIYHEHDAPQPAHSPGAIQRVVSWCRNRVASTARLCIVPGGARLERFKRDTGTLRPVFCVLNCPELREVRLDGPPGGRAHVLFYHGSLNESRLPFSVLHAIASLSTPLSLQFAGYETRHHEGFVGRFLDEARRLGIGDRVAYVGAPESRSSLLELCARATIGISFVPAASEDANLLSLAGASNKPFDYLACGLALLVSDMPDWRRMFVEPGYARACDCADPAAIGLALQWFIANPAEVQRMLERARHRLREEWNYEAQFAPVMAQMERLVSQDAEATG